MVETLNNLILAVMDPLLGWALHLPRDLVLVGVAVCTALILTLVRLGTTDQDRLSRCKRDKGRLKELIREAKKSKDKEALARYRTTLREINAVSFKAEGKPLLASIVPIAFLAVWCFARLGYVPPQGGDTVQVNAYFPLSGIGRLAHFVPRDGLTAADGWIRRVDEDRDPATGRVVNGIASWQLAAEPSEEPYELMLRHSGATVRKELFVDGVHYAPPLEFYPDAPVEAVELAMREYRPFGVVPGLAILAFPPWLIGYLIVVVPLSFALKPLLGIR